MTSTDAQPSLQSLTMAQQQTPDSPDKTLTLTLPNPSLEQATNGHDFPPSPPSDHHITLSTLSVSRLACVSKRKKGNQKRRAAQEKRSLEKLKVLVEILRPIPFLPVKTLDFASHEKLLKRIGLWDFINLDFDRSIRGDLLAQLIATFNPGTRASYVNGVRIGVNRADLARALKLPVKKDRVSVSDNFQELEESEESIAFLEEFVSIWVLLHEDTWIMPKEVLNWTKVIKEGHFEKVDWAGLFWFMIEKELMAAPKLGNCYYASHLQCLIKSQREEMLREGPTVEDDVKEVEEEDREVKELEEEDGSSRDVKEVEEDNGGSQDMKEVEEEDGSSQDVKMVGEADDFCRGKELEEHTIELSLGQENVAKADAEKERAAIQDIEENKEAEKERLVIQDVMDIEENKEDQGRWLLDGKSNAREHFLQSCNLGDVGGMECDDERKQEEEAEAGEAEEEGNEDVEEEEDEEEEEEQEGGFHLSPNDNALEAVASENLIAAMEAAQIPFSSGVQIRDNLSGEFLASRADGHTVPGGSSLFGNGDKREIDHGNDNLRHSINASNKRLRIDGPWDDKSSDFDACMEQIQHLVGKARILYAAKEQACGNSSVNEQILLTELQQRDNMIDHLHKAKLEEQQKRHVEVYRLEHELHMMTNLLEGYRRALKETQKAFAEYRARNQQRDEPLYRDLEGSGGLVLSITEIEKQRLKQEEEERMKQMLIEKNIKDFEVGWITKFEALNDNVHMLQDKYLNVESNMKLLKKFFANRKISGMPEFAGQSEG
ncbi:uncharacterized protein LOC110806575 [Carica papaya]|uniref:uncharacterized protein LOC110806575 n=1 Tax=Carica papaya TaxID=3649 RepID=UPI000B8C87C9|nr:uncharacterized protein LOC110806575 [Carica papaya]